MGKNNRFDTFHKLREQHPQFFYHGYSYKFENEEFIIEYHFSMGEAYHFRPTHRIHIPSQLKWQTIQETELEQLVFHLGMVEVISYWKASCSPQLIIKKFALTNKQILWWKKLYFQGLGEFFYLNEIQTNDHDFMDIICQSDRELQMFDSSTSQNRVMVAVGGGKDSVVSLELIKSMGKEVIPMVINPRGATIKSIEDAKFKMSHAITTRRSIAAELLELNKIGYLNGHTPFSAMLAFLTLLVSRMMDIKYVALSNESSANESTVAGTNINHQYSKSFEFEQDFRNYYQENLLKQQEYFSFLRPLSELQIACLFSRFKQHHYSFRSCNAGSKENIWCGNCPKCLFTYILLSPFIPQASLSKIFGKKLLDDTRLTPVFNELRGKTTSKPFECVGTVSEVELALSNAQKEYRSEALLKDARLERQTEKLNMTLKEWNQQHFLPEEFENVLHKQLKLCWIS
jgi:hypothetical protein